MNEQTLVEFSYRGEYAAHRPAPATRTCKILLSRSGGHVLSKMYASRGYSLDQSGDTNESTTLAVQIDGQALGTLSLHMDDGRLSAEEQYPEFIAHLRSQGARICEFGKFAIDPAVRSKRVLGAIFHLSWIAAFRARRATDLVIEVNPRHADFYRQALYFEQVGEERLCKRVGAPAVLLHISSEKLHRLVSDFRSRSALSQRERGFLSYCFPIDEENTIASKMSPN